MITVSTKQLFEAIAEADVFRLPEMNAGTEYLFNNIYSRLSGGDDVTLSSLDFSSFDTDDVESLRDLYSGTFERNSYVVGGIMSTLRQTAPIHKTVAYV